ncbi:MAG: C39 family peptidase [Chloroflexi bacterium]|uniref:C39 family peptidase n=1 Tax=Candidatus Chlorohelix allophototropha TaxID=3003348 RepID=A0A8T7MA26_9CHLR|nr:C39 family peptidase [Chloroflexota bacterium]WJW68908.1 C39 family peptidase [Chloroflexota bacterium L227-S17]
MSSGTLEVEAGKQQALRILLTNSGEKAAFLMLEARGIDPAWFGFIPPALKLGARSSAVVTATLNPPSGVSAERLLPSIVLVSVETRETLASENFILSVIDPTAPKKRKRPFRLIPSVSLFSLLMALSLALSGVVLFNGTMPGTIKQADAAPKICAIQPAKLVSLFSDDKTTAIRISNPDLTDMQVLRTEPGEWLPGLFDSLLSLSSDSSRLAYVTARNQLMDDAHIYFIDVNKPSERQELVYIPKGFWTVKPVWSPDKKRLAYLKLNEVLAARGVSQLELWVVEVGGMPRKIATPPELKPDLFFGNPSLPLCWGEDNSTIIFENAPNTGGGGAVQTEINVNTGESTSAPRPVQPRPVVREDLNARQVAGGSACGVPIFSQNDPAWRNVVMQGAGEQIGDSGCALASATMLLNYYGMGITPVQLNACLGPYADPLYWSQVPRCTNGVISGGNRPDFSWDKLDEVLRAGDPAIVGMVRGKTGMHFVVVTSGGGANGANYAVTDPWDGSTNKTLQYFFNVGYNPTWIVTYSGPGHNCNRLVASEGEPVSVTGISDGAVYRNPVTLGEIKGASTSLITAEVVNVAPDSGDSYNANPSSPGLIPGVAPQPCSTLTPSSSAASKSAATQPYIQGMRLEKEGIYYINISLRLWDDTRGPAPSNTNLVGVTRFKFTIDRTPPRVVATLLSDTNTGNLIPGVGASQPSPCLGATQSVQGQNQPPEIKGTARIRLTGIDVLSGVTSIEYQLDGGKWDLYSTDTNFNRVLEVSQEGYHTVTYRATDVAGNVSATESFTFRVLPGDQPTAAPRQAAPAFIPTPVVAPAANPTSTPLPTATYTPVTLTATLTLSATVTPKPSITPTFSPTITPTSVITSSTQTPFITATATVTATTPTLSPTLTTTVTPGITATVTTTSVSATVATTVTPTATSTPTQVLQTSASVLNFAPDASDLPLVISNGGTSAINWSGVFSGTTLLGSLSPASGTLSPGQSITLTVSVVRPLVLDAPTSARLLLDSNGGKVEVALNVQPSPISATFITPPNGTVLSGTVPISFSVKGTVDHISLSASYIAPLTATPTPVTGTVTPTPTIVKLGKANAASRWQYQFDTTAIPPVDNLTLLANACRSPDESVCTLALVSPVNLSVARPVAEFAASLSGASFPIDSGLPVTATVSGGYANHINVTLTPADSTAPILSVKLTILSGWHALVTTNLKVGKYALTGVVCWSADESLCYPMTERDNLNVIAAAVPTPTPTPTPTP